MNNILLVSPFFFPEIISTGKYNTYLAKGLVGAGISVDVYCSCSLYPDWTPECIDKKISGVKVIRGGRFMRYPSSPLLRRMFLELWFVTFVFRKTIFHRKKYDVLLLVYPPNLVSVLIPLIRARDTKVVGIVHDIQGVMANSNSYRIRSILNILIHRLERYSYRSCDYLIFLSKGMKQVARDLYSIPEKLSIVRYPFVTTDNYEGETKLDYVFEKKINTIVYSGALGEKQSPDNLMALLLEALNTDESSSALIFSQGRVFDRLKNNYHHERLFFYPLVPEEQLPELIARSSVQIVPQTVETSEGAFPSKLPNLLAGGSKVFAITQKDGELASILNQYSQASVHHSWEDINQLAHDLIALMGEDDEKTTNEDQQLLEKFSLNHLVEYILRGDPSNEVVCQVDCELTREPSNR